MFILEKNNEKIGVYLNKLILAKYEKMRRFCIAYVKLSGLDWNDSSVIAKMQNRMSQIIQGNKAIQIYDLPIFCECYIWFVDDSQYDSHERAFGFSAGTSIKRREIGYQDTLDATLRYHSEERGLRQKMIALAMENDDFSMLDCLRAREVPALYQACSYMNPQTKCKDYYSESVIKEIVESNDDKVFRYFSEDFLIKDNFGREHWFIYPYMGKLLELLIASKNKYAEAVLRCTVNHNKRVYNKLIEMVNEAFEWSEHFYNQNDNFKVPVETVVGDVMNHYQFDDEDDRV